MSLINLLGRKRSGERACHDFISLEGGEGERAYECRGEGRRRHSAFSRSMNRGEGREGFVRENPQSLREKE